MNTKRAWAALLIAALLVSSGGWMAWPSGAAAQAAEQTSHWSHNFYLRGMGGVYNLDVYALAADGAGNLYAGGLFTTAGGVAANRIARWDGSAWSALGSGMGSDSPMSIAYVSALAVDGAGNLYAGGEFATAGGVAANRIAKWDGSAWSSLGSGIDGGVQALAFDGAGNLYAGGGFSTAGGVAANCIAKWDGSSWSALGSGTIGQVNALALDGTGNLYAGGWFTTAGGADMNHIAKWNGSAWSALGSGISGAYTPHVSALAFDGAGNLYAGGTFDTAGDVAANSIAKWNGSAWSALGNGPYYVRSLAVDRAGNLYTGAEFGGAPMRWDGIAWSQMGSGWWEGADPEPPPSVHALVLDGAGSLYAGGDFVSAGNAGVNGIARWDGTVWSGLDAGQGMNRSVNVLLVDGVGNLYAGGDFTVAGGAAAHYSAKWDGSTWSALGKGTGGSNPAVYTLALDNAGHLYAGGDFEEAGDVRVDHVAKWDGSTWSPLGDGTGWGVSTLAVDGAGNLYAGGSFTSAGGADANRIAKWDGSAWSALGSGIGGGSSSFSPEVNALAVDGAGNLYAGGQFTTAGGVAANHIAKWDGSAWSALGSGMSETGYPYVSALVLDGAGHLYAGGNFDTAGGVAANNIAMWDGDSWSALGSGLDQGVEALALDGAGNLYAGGGAVVAKWDGNTWSVLASNIDEFVEALAVDGTGNLYAGGAFDVLGDKPAANIGRWERARTLTVATTGSGSGRVTSKPAGIDCGVGCSETFAVGTVVTLTATANTGATLTRWSGACTGTGPCTLTLDAAKVVTATFDVAGAVMPLGSMMYFGSQLQAKQGATAAAQPATTSLVVFTGPVPAGLFLVGVEGSEPYIDPISAYRLINRLLDTGCSGGACSAVNCTYYAADGTHRDVVITSFVMTDHVYLPQVSRE